MTAMAGGWHPPNQPDGSGIGPLILMTDHLKLALAQLNPTMGDFAGNVCLAEDAFRAAQKMGADLLVLSELFVTGYPPEDLVLRPQFQAEALSAVEALTEWTSSGPAILVGAPFVEAGQLYNAVLLLEGGEIRAKRFKVDLPNYGVFDEKRVFSPGSLPGPIDFKGVGIGVPICEDIWSSEVMECLEETGAEFFVVINGSPFSAGKADQRLTVAAARVRETKRPLLYLNQVGGQDELVFDGGSFVLDGQAHLAAQFPLFRSEIGLVDLKRTSDGWRVSSDLSFEGIEGDEAVYQAAVLGLRDYVNKNGFKGVLLGLSGGIDSALCAAMAVDALGPDRVRAVMLPYHYTSQASLDDAALCASALGISYDVVPIEGAVSGATEALQDLMPDGLGGVTEENIQSRLRGVLLMALSNKTGDMLVTTGNKSEVSVGYATLYGDMNGGFNPIKDLYKTKVYDLSRLRNERLPDGCFGPKGEVIPVNIIEKAPSAELREDQTDQDSLPPYEVLDDILDCLIEQDLSVPAIVSRGHDLEVVAKIEHLVYLAEYKRRQAAPGVKISSKNFGRDRRYPITNKFRSSPLRGSG